MSEMLRLKIGDLEARILIIQGGMGVGISLSGLASAVANEGAIGVISFLRDLALASLKFLAKSDSNIPIPAEEIIPIAPSFATAEAKLDKETPTPIPP